MQTRSTIALVIAVLMTVQSVQAQQPVANSGIQQQIAALPSKAHVALQLTGGNTVRGRITSRNQQDFVLTPDNGGAPQTIAYAQVSAIEQGKAHHSKAKWIVIGAVAGAAVVVAVIAMVAVHSPKINAW